MHGTHGVELRTPQGSGTGAFFPAFFGALTPAERRPNPKWLASVLPKKEKMNSITEFSGQIKRHFTQLAVCIKR